eukprot:Sspe_Gene.17269::Locus_6129_Transcript_1_1_Confidence_1.000_Length_2050::g.17269::m.17269/K01069/E3.1.2.6, gloB; hydroxyacylglutathione hydrolase
MAPRRLSQMPARASAVVLLVIFASVAVGVVGLAIPTALAILFCFGLWKMGFPLVYRYLYLSDCGRFAHIKLLKCCSKDETKHHSRFKDIRTEVRLAQGGVVYVHPIPYLEDNYAWLVVDPSSGPSYAACVVDAGDAGCVAKGIFEISETFYPGKVLDVQAILTTHHHWDHMAGNSELQSLVPRSGGWCVYGGDADEVYAATHTVGGGDEVIVGSMVFQVISTPCHTEGSVIFLLRGENGCDALFSGDTFFSGGCGGFFEGDLNDMVYNHATVLEMCGRATMIFPGHEYTIGLLRNSTLALDGLNTGNPQQCLDILSSYYVAKHRRDHQGHPLPTVPVPLRKELNLSVTFRMVRKCAEDLLKSIARAFPDIADPTRSVSPLSQPSLSTTPCTHTTNSPSPPATFTINPSSPGFTEGPFVAFFRSSFDKLLAELESNQVSSAEAAATLRRMKNEWDGAAGAPVSYSNAPSESDLTFALHVLGSPRQRTAKRSSGCCKGSVSPPHSISRSRVRRVVASLGNVVRIVEPNIAIDKLWYEAGGSESDMLPITALLGALKCHSSKRPKAAKKENVEDAERGFRETLVLGAPEDNLRDKTGEGALFSTSSGDGSEISEALRSMISLSVIDTNLHPPEAHVDQRHLSSCPVCSQVLCPSLPA